MRHAMAHATSSMRKAPQSTFRLLHLPPELQFIVFEYISIDSKVSSVPKAGMIW